MNITLFVLYSGTTEHLLKIRPDLRAGGLIKKSRIHRIRLLTGKYFWMKSP
jgi:hypothetical protein